MDQLSESEIFHLSLAIRDGGAEPDDAKKLLELYAKSPPLNGASKQLHDHFCRAFGAFLKGEKTIEVALGLKKSKGRPKANQEDRMEMAKELMRLRVVNGSSHQEALAEVSARFGWGETIISEAWLQHRFDGMALLRNERPPDVYPWSEKEKERLAKIFPQQEDTSGKS